MSLAGLSGAERALVEAVRALRFGSIAVVVHEGRVVRIEKVEKVRFDPDPESGGVEAAKQRTDGSRPDRRSPPVSDLGGREWNGKRWSS